MCGIAAAQSAGMPNALSPADARRLPTFEQRRGAVGPPVRSFAPASGAGRTGFDSTNARRKKTAAKKPSSAAPPPAAPTASAPVEPPPSPYQRPLPPAAETAMAARLPVTPVGALPTPVTKRRKIAAEGDPYDALGLRAGAFDLYPAVELYGGYDSNPGARADGKGSVLVTVAPELRAQSHWSRHELKADLRGSYSYYANDTTPSVSRPQATGAIDGRIDVTRNTRIDLGGRLLVGTDYPNSPNLQAGLSRLPVFTTFGGVAGLAHRFNRLELGVKGTADRTVWQSSSLVDGSSASNADRNLNQYGGVLRAGYELRPGVTPYVEAGGDTRVHDLEADFSGYRRNSKALTGRVGTSFELTRLLTGDISVGYTKRDYQDERLAPVKGLLLDASLLWTANALTTVKFTAKTNVGESTIPGVSGIFYRDAGVQVDHALRRWLIATVKFGFGIDTYQGGETPGGATVVCGCVVSTPGGTVADRQDLRYALGFGLTYKLSRELWLKGEVRREWLRSNVAGYNYDANVFLLGLRLQR